MDKQTFQEKFKFEMANFLHEVRADYEMRVFNALEFAEDATDQKDKESWTTRATLWSEAYRYLYSRALKYEVRGED